MLHYGLSEHMGIQCCIYEHSGQVDIGHSMLHYGHSVHYRHSMLHYGYSGRYGYVAKKRLKCTELAMDRDARGDELPMCRL